ncbi:periplasmic heavy metal sensor [Alphaproteobacteria bacterium]|nr:periplasmic heavy metal sensor [Alphaproteobacteria bacterium]
MLKNKKFLYIILALSLALNVFILGVAGYYGYQLRGFGEDGQWIEKRITRLETRFLQPLDGPDQSFARGVFRERRPELRKAFAQLGDARHDVGTALRAADPDPGTLTAAIDKSQGAADMVNKSLHGLLRDLAQGLSLEARQKISEHIRDRHSHHERNSRDEGDNE